MTKKISVIMSTYNEPINWIKKSIESILIQTYRNFEFIIICDNPDNVELIDYLRKIQDKRIITIFNKENIGLAKSLNKGLEFAKGDFIARMDADDISFPERFSVQMDYFEKYPEIDLIGTNMNIINENDEIISISNGKAYSKNKLKKLLPKTNLLNHPTFMGKKILFDRLGGYRLFDAAEDYDFVLRALDDKFHLVVIPEVLLLYRKRSNSMGLGSALVSITNSNYIQELHKMRNTVGYDDYSIEEMKSQSTFSDYEKEIFSNVIFSIYVRHRKNFLLLICDVFQGYIKSHYFRQYFFSMLRVQIIRRLPSSKNVIEVQKNEFN